MERQQIFKFTGTLLFSSINTFHGFKTSRRDDIESAFHLLIYLLNDEKLPWCDSISKKNGNIDMMSEIRQRLLNRNMNQNKLFDMVPNELKACLAKVLSLGFFEEPPYEYIFASLKDCFIQALLTDFPSQARRLTYSASDRERFYGSYTFEWARTRAWNVRNSLLAASERFEQGLDDNAFFKNKNDNRDRF